MDRPCSQHSIPTRQCSPGPFSASLGLPSGGGSRRPGCTTPAPGAQGARAPPSSELWCPQPRQGAHRSHPCWASGQGGRPAQPPGGSCRPGPLEAVGFAHPVRQPRRPSRFRICGALGSCPHRHWPDPVGVTVSQAAPPLTGCWATQRAGRWRERLACSVQGVCCDRVGIGRGLGLCQGGLPASAA